MDKRTNFVSLEGKATATLHGDIRVPIHLEEAPAFIFSARGGGVSLTQYRWEQGERTWRVHFDRHHPLPGDLAQRVWLALAYLYEEQNRPANGFVFYSATRIAEIIRLSRKSGDVRARIAIAIEQLDGLRVYVEGQPLAGPSVEPERRRAGPGGPRETRLYSFLGGQGLSTQEETNHHQLYLPLPGTARRDPSLRASRALSAYVVESLRGQHGRLVPDFVFGLRSAYAVRLTRLLGKRANGRPALTIGLGTLIPALPAVGVDGQPLAAKRLLQTLHRAHDELLACGFLRDVTLEAGQLRYRFAGRHVAVPIELSEHGESVVDELIAATGKATNRDYYRLCVAELGADRVNAALADTRATRVPAADLARVLGANLQRMRRENNDNQADAREEFRQSFDADIA